MQVLVPGTKTCTTCIFHKVFVMREILPARIVAVVETVFVFIATFVLLKFVQGNWLNRWAPQSAVYRVSGYAVILIVTLLAIALTRVPFRQFGMSLANGQQGLHFALANFPFVLAISLSLNFLAWRYLLPALLIFLIELIVLFILIQRLQDRPAKAYDLKKDLLLLLLIVAVRCIVQIVMGRSIADTGFLLLFYLFIVSPVEELLFRGYIQTRINAAFDRKFHFRGIEFGMGLPVAAALFGLAHLFNPFNPWLGQFALSIPWGLWTFGLGLVLGIVREKEGSLLAPILIHFFVNFF